MKYSIVDTDIVEIASGERCLHLAVKDFYVHVWLTPCPKDLIELHESSSLSGPEIAEKDGSIVVNVDSVISIAVSEDLNPRFLLHGKPLFCPALTESEDEARFDFEISKDAKIYGLGDKMAPLNKRGYFYRNWNTDDPHPQNENFESLYKSINYLLVYSSNVFYGLYFPSTYAYEYDLAKTDPDCVKVKLNRGYADFYFIRGLRPHEVTANYSRLVGRPYFIRMKMLGNQQSRWSYGSEKDVREVARKYKENNLPLDYIHLDIDYMDGYRDFTVNSEKFPNLAKLSDDLRKQGIGLVCINDAGIKVDPDYDIYAKCIENDWEAKNADGSTYVNEVWPGESIFPCYINQGCAEFFSEKAKLFVDRYGIEGIWNDMNEPASFKGPLPDDVVFKAGRDIRHDEYHNVYAEAMARYCVSVYEDDNRRPYVFTRAALATTAKYAFAWNGDNQSLWHHLALSIPQILSMGLSNFMIDGVDIGGFCGDCTKELLIRWCEGNILMPFFRNHSAIGTRAQEPYAYDEETTAIYRKFLEFRYRLIPYLYTLAHNAHAKGYPIVRPLFFNYPWDPNTFEINDQYMVGGDIIMAPILNQGQTVRSVYLPLGDWYDYFSGKLYEGKRYVQVELPLGETAVFVRKGAIIPEFEGLTSINRKKITRIVYHIFGDSADGEVYDDDGDSLDYRQGTCNVYRLAYRNGILSSTSSHHYKTPYKEIKVIHGDKEVIIPFARKFEIKI